VIVGFLRALRASVVKSDFTMKKFLDKLNPAKMSAPLRRRAFVIAVGAVVLLLVGYGFLPKPVTVDMAIVKRAPLRVTLEEEGRTRVKDRFVVSAPVAGYLRRITLEVGDTVSKGQKVALLDPPASTVLDPRSRAEAEATAATARAAYEATKEKARSASADAMYAAQRIERSRKLYEGGYISRDDFEQAEADAKRTEALRLSSQAAVVGAQADLDRAEAALRHSGARGAGGADETVIVRSPVAGSVLKVRRESEGTVSSGEPLLDIGDPRNMEILVEVLSADAVKIRKGTPVLFERWGGEQPLEGTVRVVEPAGFTKVSSLGVEEQRVNVIVDLASPLERWKRLGDGYRLEAVFVLWEGADVLQVPASALFRSGEGWAVFAIEQKRARLKAVEIGRRNGLSAEILSGLAEGAVVVASPDDQVTNGVRVKLR